MSRNASQSSESVIHSDGSINLKLLTREISTDITSNESFKAEDSMKKRAIHTSKSMESNAEFFISRHTF